MPRWIPLPLTAQHCADGWGNDDFMSPLVLALNAATVHPWRLAGPRAIMQVPGGGFHPGRDQVWRLPASVQGLLACLAQEDPVPPCTLRLPQRFAPFLSEG